MIGEAEGCDILPVHPCNRVRRGAISQAVVHLRERGVVVIVIAKDEVDRPVEMDGNLLKGIIQCSGIGHVTGDKQDIGGTLFQCLAEIVKEATPVNVIQVQVAAPSDAWWPGKLVRGYGNFLNLVFARGSLFHG